MGADCDLTGHTEKETLMSEVSWASSWLKTISEELKAARRLVQACARNLADRGPKTVEEKCSASVMMLRGFLSTYEDNHVERINDEFHDNVDHIVKTAGELEDIGRGKKNIPVKAPWEVTPDVTVESFDQQMLDQYLREIMNGVEHIQDILAKYGKSVGATAQVHMKIVNSQGIPIVIEGLDPIPCIKKFLEDKQIREAAKLKADAEIREAELKREAEKGNLPGPGTTPETVDAVEVPATDGEHLPTTGETDGV